MTALDDLVRRSRHPLSRARFMTLATTDGSAPRRFHPPLGLG
ncbi:hypothetical protein [Kitasatospora sp. NPDC001527]